MADNRRVFARVNAALLRRGRVIATLTDTSGYTLRGVPQMTGSLKGRPGFWVSPGVSVTFAWQVSNEQPDAAWLEADAQISSVADGRVAVAGTSPSRPHPQRTPAQ